MREEGERAESPGRPALLRHLFEKGVPRSGIQMTSPVFIEATARPTVFLANVEGFSESEVVSKG